MQEKKYGKMRVQGRLRSLVPFYVAGPEVAQRIGRSISFPNAAVRGAGRRVPYHPARADFGATPKRVTIPS